MGVFRFISEKKLRDCVAGAEAYVRRSCVSGTEACVSGAEASVPPGREAASGFRDDGARFSLEIGDPYGGAGRLRRDGYDPGAVDRVMDAQSSGRSPEELDALLGRAVKLSFVEKVAELIREKGIRDPVVYKAAQLDRRLYSKLMSDPAYRPSLDTAVAIALALRLPLDEAEDLLARAGHTLSHSIKRDVVIEYFFRERIYDLTYVNLILDRLRLRKLGR